jgi:Protein of unknown function (DUF3606)
MTKYIPASVESQTDRIDIHDLTEMRIWVKAFGISEEKLVAAVAVAGTDAAKVRLHLSKVD